MLRVRKLCKVCGKQTVLFSWEDTCRSCKVEQELKHVREQMCSGDVESAKHGYWVEEDTAVTCSVCTRSYDTDFEIKRGVILSFKYCPECGAKMSRKECK